MSSNDTTAATPAIDAAAPGIPHRHAAALDDLILLGARVFIGAVFWQSGRTKVDGFSLNESAVFLFEEEYQLPIIDPTFAAGAAAIAEHALPVFLVLGLFTRYAAFALLMMTAVIQIFVYPGAWPTHGTWAALLALLIAKGPGRAGLDTLIARRR